VEKDRLRAHIRGMTTDPLMDCLAPLKILHSIGGPRAIWEAGRAIDRYMARAGSDLEAQREAVKVLGEAWQHLSDKTNDPALIWNKIHKIERDLGQEAKS
jgi:hypothetical protein